MVIRYIEKLSVFKIIALMCAFKVFVSLFINLIGQIFLESQDFDNSSLDGLEGVGLFIVVVILAPLLESLLFQFIIIEAIILIFSYLKIKQDEVVAVIISSIFFSLTHTYSHFYLFISFIGGLILGSFYIFAKNKKGMNGFLTVFIVHSFSNLITFLINLFFY
jgi:membrane protease YdiL (CAAX protease family)